MGCVGSTPAEGDGNVKKIRKPKPWKHPQPITKSQFVQIREEFWDTAPHYGGSKGVIVQNADLTICYDERGAKYELPKYVLSEPTNLIQDS
ncbi:hypothetical protein CRYUN_Cryun33cG0017400 [Craigia yunnanensis]